MKYFGFVLVIVGLMLIFLMLPTERSNKADTLPGVGTVGFEGGDIRLVTPTPGGIHLRP